MENIYIIDISLLNNQNISIDELKVLISVSQNKLKNIDDTILNILQEKGFIKIIIEENEKIVVTREKGKLLIESFQTISMDLTETKKITRKSSRQINNDIDDFIIEFRNLWKGLKPGSMGSQNACKDKLGRWMKENPSYSKEDIIRAAKAYIKSLNDYRFLQAADYFIFKKDLKGESSRLSAFIDESDTPDDEWSSKLL